MRRRDFLLSTVAAATAAGAWGREKSIDPAVAAILGSSDVWDMTVPWGTVHRDMEILRRYKRAGFTFMSLTMQDSPPTFEGTLESIRSFREEAKRESDWLVFGESVAEIESGKRAGKLVLGINLQETLQIGMDLSRLETLHAAGVRHMLLAYQIRNFVADGCAEAADAGLSNYGRLVVKQMIALASSLTALTPEGAPRSKQSS